MKVLQTPDPQHLARWFAHKMPEREGLRIAQMKRSFPGMSRETWFITLAWQAGTQPCEERYVLRTQLPGNVAMSSTPLEHEAAIYQRLGSTAVPVPKLKWLETDPHWLIDGERPFFVREMAPGVLEPAHVRDMDTRYDGVRVAMVKELIDKLATLHLLDWRALGFDHLLPVPPTPADCARFELDNYLRELRLKRLQPFPAATEAILSLRDQPPPPPARIVLRKENNGLGEEIWAEQGTRIVAMSDWETASLGDPALDLAIALRTTGWAWTLDGMLDHYERRTGWRIAPASVQFYAAMWKIKMVVNLHASLAHYNSGKDRRIQLCSLGIYTHMAEMGVLHAAGN